MQIKCEYCERFENTEYYSDWFSPINSDTNSRLETF